MACSVLSMIPVSHPLVTKTLGTLKKKGQKTLRARGQKYCRKRMSLVRELPVTLMNTQILTQPPHKSNPLNSPAQERRAS